MKKMDEMQMSLNLRAIRWSYLFTVIALFIWTVYDFIRSRTVSPACYLLIAQNLVYYIANNLAKWRVGDEDGRRSLLLYLALLVFFLVLFGLLLFLFGSRGSAI